MKKFALLLTAAFSMTLILDSCSVQKRYHRKGFTVNWNNASVNMKKNRKVVHTETIQEDAFVSNTQQKKKLTKNYETPVSMDIASTSVAVPSIKNASPSTLEPVMVKNQASTATSAAKEMSKEDVKSTKKAAKKIIKAIKKNQQQDSKTDTIIYLLLILLVPFGTTISMYLYEGSWTGRVTANLLLTLLCGLPGLIHALVVIFGNK
ncbi:MAG: hypothetical protein L7U23_09345 [Crocinitomicaceae bacterium]|jgi:uncharacterized membrane protein YqaE (UPF0057 family)|nr:hypothetical protein [Crocinitomicaceae bacterium]